MATGHTVHYRFHHRHLIVADAAKTVAFYEDAVVEPYCASARCFS
jgi:hypothetical protein